MDHSLLATASVRHDCTMFGLTCSITEHVAYCMYVYHIAG